MSLSARIKIRQKALCTLSVEVHLRHSFTVQNIPLNVNGGGRLQQQKKI
jgi:hypothetical protein